MGTQESLYHGVPLIGIPLFGDQLTNLMYYKRKGMAVKLDFDKINERNMYDALNTVLNDPSYRLLIICDWCSNSMNINYETLCLFVYACREAAKLQSSLFRDRPMSALDTSMYWIEYVVRHKHGILKSPAVDLTWWQVALLDVYAFLVFITGIAVCILILIIKTVLGLVAPSKGSATSSKRTKRD